MDKLIDVLNQILYKKALNEAIKIYCDQVIISAGIQREMIYSNQVCSKFLSTLTSRDLVNHKIKGYNWKENKGL